MKTRWELVRPVADRIGVDPHTVRNWGRSGYVELRRDGPRLYSVKVHDGGELDGRPVTVDEESEAAA